MAVAAPLALAATGLSAAGSMMGAMSASSGDQMESQQAENAATIAQTQAYQTDASMRRKLSSSMSNIMAVRASAGLNPNSPTGAAISANVEGQGNLNRTQAVDNIQAQVTSDQQAASFYSQSASNAITGGIFGAMGSMFKGFSGGIPTS